MGRQLVPICVKPHLVGFLMKEFKTKSLEIDGCDRIVADVTARTELGKTIHLLLTKTNKKPCCDKKDQIFLSVVERVKKEGNMKFIDGRSSFLCLSEEASAVINRKLEAMFETAYLYWLHSWRESGNGKSLDKGIVEFFSKFNLDEYDFNIPKIRRNYYRKSKGGYFNAQVVFDQAKGQEISLNSF